MQFNPGARVLALDGQEAGTISRVVIDPKTKEVTRLVIHTGVVMTHDKVVPVNLVGVDEQEHLMLRLYVNQLEQLPDFEETHYLPVKQAELQRSYQGAPPVLPPAVYRYPPYRGTVEIPYPEPPYAQVTQSNIPVGKVALKKGAKVVSADGEDFDVERVLTSPQTDHATHFIISKRGAAQSRETGASGMGGPVGRGPGGHGGGSSGHSGFARIRARATVIACSTMWRQALRSFERTETWLEEAKRNTRRNSNTKPKTSPRVT